MNATLELDNSCPQFTATPPESDFLKWANAALAHLPTHELDKGVILGVRIVDEQESAHLNNTYRHKNSATNVLSFGCDLPMAVLAGLDEIPIGDLAICAPVVEREATEQHKAKDAHWAHMLIHGLLHLHGYDHEQDADAQKMEVLEREILASLGFPDPYLNEQGTTQNSLDSNTAIPREQEHFQK